MEKRPLVLSRPRNNKIYSVRRLNDHRDSFCQEQVRSHEPEIEAALSQPEKLITTGTAKSQITIKQKVLDLTPKGSKIPWQRNVGGSGFCPTGNHSRLPSHNSTSSGSGSEKKLKMKVVQNPLELLLGCGGSESGVLMDHTLALKVSVSCSMCDQNINK
jgi:hypothetical protein